VKRSKASGGVASGAERGEERWSVNEGELRISRRRGDLTRTSWMQRRRVLATWCRVSEDDWPWPKFKFEN
jgi:hypothetical protein